MMPRRTLVLVTTNQGKLREFRAALRPLGFDVRSVAREYPEIQADDFKEVAKFGVDWLRARGLSDFILEDAGLRIRALGGFPGVYSKFGYQTIGCAGILRLMCGVRDRRAEFVSVIGGEMGGRVFTVRGVSKGAISTRPRGRGGFGFDPIFIPDGEKRTFAQMTVAEKNSISHRGAAIRALVRKMNGVR